MSLPPDVIKYILIPKLDIREDMKSFIKSHNTLDKRFNDFRDRGIRDDITMVILKPEFPYFLDEYAKIIKVISSYQGLKSLSLCNKELRDYIDPIIKELSPMIDSFETSKRFYLTMDLTKNLYKKSCVKKNPVYVRFLKFKAADGTEYKIPWESKMNFMGHPYELLNITGYEYGIENSGNCFCDTCYKPFLQMIETTWNRM